MAAGKKQITKAICVDEDDINTFKELRKLGVVIEAQRVPTEQKEDIFKYID
jgi:PTS system N-acetylgalactosamine-specific IIB component